MDFFLSYLLITVAEFSRSCMKCDDVIALMVKGMHIYSSV